MHRKTVNSLIRASPFNTSTMPHSCEGLVSQPIQTVNNPLECATPKTVEYTPEKSAFRGIERQQAFGECEVLRPGQLEIAQISGHQARRQA